MKLLEMLWRDDVAVFNLAISGIFLITVILLAGHCGLNHINAPWIQIPATVGLFWFFGAFLVMTFKIGGIE